MEKKLIKMECNDGTLYLSIIVGILAIIQVTLAYIQFKGNL